MLIPFFYTKILNSIGFELKSLFLSTNLWQVVIQSYCFRVCDPCVFGLVELNPSY